MKHEIPIPDGYDVLSSEFHISWNYGTNKEEDVIITRLEKKQTKDFSFYVDQYLYDNGSTNDQIVNWLSDDIISVAKHRLKTSQFSLVPWEIKIGLFRFICDEHKMTWNDIVGFFVYYNSGTINNCSEQYLGNRVISILPQEFIDDLFKTKN